MMMMMMMVHHQYAKMSIWKKKITHEFFSI